MGLFGDSGHRWADPVAALCLVALCVTKLDQSCGTESRACTVAGRLNPKPLLPPCVLCICASAESLVFFFWLYTCVWVFAFTCVHALLASACARDLWTPGLDLAFNWLWLLLMLYGPCHLLCPHPVPFPRPVKIHTATQSLGESSHLLRGTYEANDFQGLMMRKEVENWGWCAMKTGGGGDEEKEKNNLVWNRL